jgi:hypothetical protein
VIADHNQRIAKSKFSHFRHIRNGLKKTIFSQIPTSCNYTGQNRWILLIDHYLAFKINADTVYFYREP